MIKIEVTGSSIAEVSDKLLAIGASLQRTVSYDADNAAREALQAARTSAVEAARAPAEEKPKRTRKAAEGNEQLSSTPTEVKSPATDESASAYVKPVAEASTPSELNFDTDVAPVVLRVVQSKGKPAVEAVLEEFGVARASQLEASRWPELIEKLEELG